MHILFPDGYLGKVFVTSRFSSLAFLSLSLYLILDWRTKLSLIPGNRLRNFLTVAALLFYDEYFPIKYRSFSVHLVQVLGLVSFSTCDCTAAKSTVPSKVLDWSTSELPKENELLPLEKDIKRHHCQNYHQLFLYKMKNCSL